MGIPQKRIAHFEPDEYLALEHAARTKHEYLDGVIYAWQGFVPLAMAGGTLRHNRVSGNVYASLRAQLKGSGCSVFMADVRLNNAERSVYFYPDVVVTCSPADLARDDGISEPRVVVEVLSDSTEDFDRGDKFSAYQAIGSLETVVLISPDRRTLEVFRRAAGWTLSTTAGSAEAVDLGTNGLRLTRADVFEGL